MQWPRGCAFSSWIQVGVIHVMFNFIFLLCYYQLFEHMIGIKFIVIVIDFVAYSGKTVLTFSTSARLYSKIILDSSQPFTNLWSQCGILDNPAYPVILERYLIFMDIFIKFINDHIYKVWTWPFILFIILLAESVSDYSIFPVYFFNFSQKGNYL